jgi:cell division protein ZapD
MIKIEFPINEKFRKYLKLEYLFNQYDFFIKQKHHQYISNVIFNIIFKLNSNAARADIKVELINDLQRILNKYKNQNEEATKLKKRLEKINSFSSYSLSSNKMMQELKVRSESPIGINDIDFSKYKIWNELQNTRSRNIYYKNLSKDLLIIKEAIYFILRIIRKQTSKENLIANDMMAQIKLNPLIRFDLLTISLKSSISYEASISANKYAININFTHPEDDKKIKKIIKFTASLHHL